MKKIAKEEIVYNVKELSGLLAETLGEIKALIETNEFVCDESKIEKLLRYQDYDNHIGRASQRTIKRLNRQIRFWSLKPNRHSANRLLHFLRTILGINFSGTIKIKPSVKEQLIQKKRIVWKKLRDEAEKALLDYKKEKGDFYKARLYERTLELV